MDIWFGFVFLRFCFVKLSSGFELKLHSFHWSWVPFGQYNVTVAENVLKNYTILVKRNQFFEPISPSRDWEITCTIKWCCKQTHSGREEVYIGELDSAIFGFTPWKSRFWQRNIKYHLIPRFLSFKHHNPNEFNPSKVLTQYQESFDSNPWAICENQTTISLVQIILANQEFSMRDLGDSVKFEE